MSLVESGFYRAWEVVTNFVILSALWLLCCLPVVTVYPATAAMFGVFHDWTSRNESGVLRNFLNAFRENFRRSIIIELVWVPLGLFLAFDIFVILRMSGVQQFVLTGLFTVFAVLYLVTSIYMFPVLVSFDLGWRGVLRNSLLLSTSRIGTTAACVVVAGVAGVLVVRVPALFLVLGSVTAYAVFRLCHRDFAKVVNMRSR